MNCHRGAFKPLAGGSSTRRSWPREWDPRDPEGPILWDDVERQQGATSGYYATFFFVARELVADP